MFLTHITYVITNFLKKKELTMSSGPGTEIMSTNPEPENKFWMFVPQNLYSCRFI